jgi:hypothetical protein
MDALRAAGMRRGLTARRAEAAREGARDRGARMEKKALSVEEFLAGYSPEVREVALRLRALVLDALPEATERVHPGWKVMQYGRDATMAGMIFAISPLSASVNLGVSRGATLPDPAGLLRGTGKQIRHVKLTRREEVDAPALRGLIDAAIAAG